jgi:hypothetical protein
MSASKEGGESMGARETDQQLQRRIEDYVEAWRKRDLEAKAAFYHPDAVQEWPQSGEQVRGLTNIGAIDENYPGLPDPTIRRIVGRDDLWVLEVTLDYGGKIVHGCSILEMAGGRIARETSYFADPFEPAEWRAQWVERTE